MKYGINLKSDIMPVILKFSFEIEIFLKPIPFKKSSKDLSVNL